MQISEINAKLNQISQAWEKFKEVNDRKLADIERKGHADPLNDVQLKKINHEMNEQKKRLNMVEAAMSRPSADAVVEYAKKDSHTQDFLNYVRKGVEKNLLQYETKSLATTSPEEGGYLVSETVSKNIVKAVAAKSVMRQLASIERISTDSLDVIIDTDDFQSGWVNETDERRDTQNAQIKKSRIHVHEMYAQPKATQKLIDDASVDIGKWISEKLIDSFVALENEAFLHGNGKEMPQGILKSDSIDKQEASFDIETLLLNHYSLNSNYAQNAKYLMHRELMQSLRSIKDDNGQYIWAPSIAAGQPDTLFGAEVVECSAMPSSDRQKDSLLAYGDFSAAYKIVDRQDIRILRDPFTAKPFVKFYATKRVGGAIIDSKALRLLSFA